MIYCPHGAPAHLCRRDHEDPLPAAGSVAGPGGLSCAEARIALGWYINLFPDEVDPDYDGAVLIGARYEFLQELLNETGIDLTPHAETLVASAAGAYQAWISGTKPEPPAPALDLTKAAHFVLHTYGESGQWLRPGGFYEALVKAAVRADPDNLARISVAFPTIAYCVTLYKADGPTPLIGLVRG